MLRRFSAAALVPCSALVLLACLGFTYAAPHLLASDPLPIGSAAPMTDYEMVSTSGQSHTLAATAGENGLLVIFSCNTCPWVLKWENRYNGLAAAAAERGIGTILVNANEGQRDGVDSMEKMREHAASRGYTMPYVVDERHRLADAFGASRTPDVFLFNADLKLVYRGAIDDNAADAGAVEEAFLMNALHALAAGETATPATTRSIGCTIKRTG